jgi:hypothetical protein
MVSYNYFFNEFSPNIFSYIFGNGPPHTESHYGGVYANLNFRGVFMSDVGYAQLFALFGVFGLLLFLNLFYKTLTHRRLEIRYKYTVWFVLFIIFSNILSGIVLNNSTIICLVFVFYILECNYRENHPLVNK